MPNYTQLFDVLGENLEGFIKEVGKHKSSLQATDRWTVKDVLCHIVFWHESYAANYRALALHRAPPLLDGPGYELNEQSVATLRRHSTQELISRLTQAQNSLHHSVVEKKVPRMTYKKHGRVYTTQEFLDLVAHHLQTHTKQIRRAK